MTDTGWICPKCNSVWSPLVRQCSVCAASAYRELVDKQAGTKTCPCRRENGGSGICGCILGGVQIIS